MNKSGACLDLSWSTLIILFKCSAPYFLYIAFSLYPSGSKHFVRSEITRLNESRRVTWFSRPTVSLSLTSATSGKSGFSLGRLVSPDHQHLCFCPLGCRQQSAVIMLFSGHLHISLHECHLIGGLFSLTAVDLWHLKTTQLPPRSFVDSICCKKSGQTSKRLLGLMPISI